MENETQETAKLSRLPYETDGGAGTRASIGLLVLESDLTIEWEMRALTDLPGVAVYHARLANDSQVTPDTLAKMEEELPKAAALLPGYLGLKAIGYGCTSGATIIGEDRVADILTKPHPKARASNPLTAAKAAFEALGIKRLGLVTPYTPDVTLAMRDRFAEAGIDVTNIGSYYQDSDDVVGRISPKAIKNAALQIGRAEDVDGVFISCTSLRAASIIEETETALGKPVTASNHALAWHLLRLSGIADTVPGFGRLFHSQLAHPNV